MKCTFQPCRRVHFGLCPQCTLHADPRWLAADVRGSIVAVTDDTGAVTTKNTYDEFGMPDSGNQGRFQYTGQMWLAEVGLYHYKNRVYAPGIGRFLQADPIGYVAGMNLYAYVDNDPINFTDPWGLFSYDDEESPPVKDTIVVTAPRPDPHEYWNERQTVWFILDMLNWGNDFSEMHLTRSGDEAWDKITTLKVCRREGSKCEKFFERQRDGKNKEILLKLCRHNTKKCVDIWEKSLLNPDKEFRVGFPNGIVVTCINGACRTEKEGGYAN